MLKNPFAKLLDNNITSDKKSDRARKTSLTSNCDFNRVNQLQIMPTIVDYPFDSGFIVLNNLMNIEIHPTILSIILDLLRKGVDPNNVYEFLKILSMENQNDRASTRRSSSSSSNKNEIPYLKSNNYTNNNKIQKKMIRKQEDNYLAKIFDDSNIPKKKDEESIKENVR